MSKPPFFTWTDKTYAEPVCVPETLREEIRRLWLKGATPEQLSDVFKLPLDWVLDFALEEPKTPRPN